MKIPLQTMLDATRQRFLVEGKPFGLDPIKRGILGLCSCIYGHPDGNIACAIGQFIPKSTPDYDDIILEPEIFSSVYQRFKEQLTPIFGELTEEEMYAINALQIMHDGAAQQLDKRLLNQNLIEFAESNNLNYTTYYDS